MSSRAVQYILDTTYGKYKHFNYLETAFKGMYQISGRASSTTELSLSTVLAITRALYMDSNTVWIEINVHRASQALLFNLHVKKEHYPYSFLLLYKHILIIIFSLFLNRRLYFYCIVSFLIILLLFSFFTR